MGLKPIVVCVLSGALTLGGAGVAAAASSTSNGSTPVSGAAGTGGSSKGTFNCANAPKALARIAKLEAKAQAWLPKAEARETKATQSGHTKLAAKIAKRVQRVQKLEVAGNKRAAHIQSLCPGAAPASSNSAVGGTTS
jgi:hypothetical protein